MRERAWRWLDRGLMVIRMLRDLAALCDELLALFDKI